METKLSNRKYAEYIQDLTALGNPLLLALVSFAAIRGIHFVSHGYVWAVLIGGFLLNELICSTIKYIWHKPRPNAQEFANAAEKIDAGSFPSIHAARISFVYSTLAYTNYLQVGTYYFLVVSIIVILLVGYSRVFLRKHFLIDVVAGYCFGLTMFALSLFFW